MSEESAASTSNSGKHDLNSELACGESKSLVLTELKLLFSPSSLISISLFLALIGLTFYCFGWKHETMLKHALAQSVEFDENGRSNLLIKGERALYHGYNFSAEKIFVHSIKQLQEARDTDSSDNAGKYWLNIAACKSGLAQVKLEEKKKQEAAALAKEALDICKQYMKPNPSKIDNFAYGDVLTTAAETELAAGNAEAAEQLFKQAQSILKQTGNEDELKQSARRYELAKEKLAHK